MISLPADAEHELQGDNFDVVFSVRNAILAISSRSTIASLRADSLLEMAKEAIAILNPEYGIGFCRDERRGPTLRALIEEAVHMDHDDKAGWARAILISAAKRTIAKNKEATSQ